MANLLSDVISIDFIHHSTSCLYGVDLNKSTINVVKTNALSKLVALQQYLMYFPAEYNTSKAKFQTYGHSKHRSLNIRTAMVERPVCRAWHQRTSTSVFYFQI
jgi:hypothetical protein